MNEPTFGVVDGQEVHAHTRHYQGRLLTPRQALAGVDGFNAKVAVSITSSVGTMWCAYAFCVLALVSLPATLVKASVVPASTFPHFLVGEGLIGLVSWVAQTFIQLVLLAVILVGQRVQATAADARSAKQFEDTAFIREQVELAGGLKKIFDAIDELRGEVTNTRSIPEPRRGPHSAG